MVNHFHKTLDKSHPSFFPHTMLGKMCINYEIKVLILFEF